MYIFVHAIAVKSNGKVGVSNVSGSSCDEIINPASYAVRVPHTYARTARAL